MGEIAPHKVCASDSDSGRVRVRASDHSLLAQLQ